MSPTLEKDGPPGALYNCSKNGCTTEELFVLWLKHFKKNVQPTPERPVLLILDNHYSHITIESYELCRKSGITMVSIPPHTSHRLQPLDVAFFGPLKSAYNIECDRFMKTNQYKFIRPDDFANLFNKAYSRIATVAKGIAGFKSTGIYPLDPNLFSEEEFCRSSEYPQANSSQRTLNEEVSNSLPNQPGPKKDHVPFQNVSPVPGASKPAQKRSGAAKQHSQILTSTPVKERLEAKKIFFVEQQKKKELKEKKKLAGGNKRSCRRKLNVELDSTSSSDEDVEREVQLLNDDSSDDDLMELSSDKCLFCNDYGRDGEMWFRCTMCGRWAHAECSGWDKPDGYKCDFCVKKC